MTLPDTSAIDKLITYFLEAEDDPAILEFFQDARAQLADLCSENAHLRQVLSGIPPILDELSLKVSIDTENALVRKVASEIRTLLCKSKP